jgi:hypothetical protein
MQHKGQQWKGEVEHERGIEKISKGRGAIERNLNKHELQGRKDMERNARGRGGV